MVKIVSNPSPLQRVTTGLYSFDRAFAGIKTAIGYPVNTMNEVYGPTHCGKSTVVWSLSGILASAIQTNISLADFEGFDVQFLQSVYDSVGFEGSLKIMNDPTDEARLDSLVSGLKDGYRIGIIDSVGAISPISESEGDLGDANMGRRAKLIAQFSRKVTHALVDYSNPSAIFVINHVHPNLGFVGTSTPGGKTLEYLAGIRTKLKQVERFPDGSYRVLGEVVKNKYGQLGGKFNLMILAGQGINADLTAYIDALELEKITAKNGVVRNLNGDKICRTGELLEAARTDNHELFVAFHNLLNEENTNNDISTKV